VRLGELRVRIDHREPDGSFQRQWCFDATIATDDIRVVGPGTASGRGRGTDTAVWLDLTEIDAAAVLPAAVARLVVANRGLWPEHVIEIDERPHTRGGRSSDGRGRRAHR
jgi:hypothetical protein